MAVPPELSSASAHPVPIVRPETPHHELTTDPEPSLPPSQQDTSSIEPLYFSSLRDLEDTFRAMHPHFEGRESEGNWMARDSSVMRLRRYLKGNAASDYHTPFTNNVRQMLDGILKVANSLRTTMSTNGCHLVQELARTLGSAVDPMVELLMQNMMKMCSATKNISAQNGNATIDILLNYVSYNLRLVQHLWNAVQDKNVQPRQFAAGWMKTLMRRQAQNKSQFEHSGGLEILDKCIRKGLADANPKVRETMRGAFWVFTHIWEERGESIMGGLDAKSRQLLEKDPSNPNPSRATFTTSVGPSSSTNPRAAASSARSTLKDTIAAQKKAALAAKRIPDRPNSAMADLSPMKQVGPPPSKSPGLAHGTATRNHPPTSQASSSKATKTSTTTGHGSLMSGPVRRPKRPDVPRPATADPYANRRLLREGSPPSRDSEQSPSRSVSKSSTMSSNTTHAKSGSSHTNRPGTSGNDKSSQITSPRTSPVKQRPRTAHGEDAVSALSPKPGSAEKTKSPSLFEENMTMVVPNSDTLNQKQKMHNEAENEGRHQNDTPSSVQNTVDDDNFTLVIPSKMSATGTRDRRDSSTIAGPLQEASAQETLPPQPAETSLQAESRPVEKVSRDEASQANLDVHEDPSAVEEESHEDREPHETVLRERPINEQVLQPPFHADNREHPATHAEEDIRIISPSKKGIAMTIDGVNQDRAEVMKNRRILSSGIERLRAKTLDAHGFRRLQDLVRIPAHDSASQISELLVVLVAYLEARPESLKVNPTKANSLKSQALTTLRGVVTLHKGSIDVRQYFSHAICATLIARQMIDNAPHFATDLERTANEVVKNAQYQLVDCLDSVLDLVSRASASGAEEQYRMATMALSVLGKLQVALRHRSIDLNSVQKQQLGKLIVRFLDDRDPDVRRADTELCLEMFGHFGEDRKEEFWSLLKGARETQLNLVAYYLARRMQGVQ